MVHHPYSMDPRFEYHVGPPPGPPPLNRENLLFPMATIRYPNVSGGTNMGVSGNGPHVDEDTMFTSSCWPNRNMNENSFGHSLTLQNSIGSLEAEKLLLDSPISQEENEIEVDALDKLFLGSQPTNTSLAELKPLPPFTGYTANLSINGIQGHHYHTISQRIPEENNNSYNSYNEHDIVSSTSGKSLYSVGGVVKLGYADCANPDSASSGKLYTNCNHSDSGHIKTEIGDYDISLDLANIIGSAMADTTVPNTNQDSEGPTGSRDSWMDFEALIDNACVDQQKDLIINQDGLSEFAIACSDSNFNQQPKQEYPNKIQQGGSTLQTLLTHGYMPLLQDRLTNGPPIKQETPTSKNFRNDLLTTSSPPANVVSTTDNLMLSVNGRFMPQYSVHGLDDHRIESPDLLGSNYPHTTTTTTQQQKKPRSRAQKKQQASSTVFQTDQNLGLIGKEKPVHRCNICNRGFLNKSNIKVHLRTHTGEKPFRCDTCAKAFRQKAHLLKHQQIHKRIGRD